MTYRPHISMIPGTHGWGVFAPRERQRIIGKNNTFRTFREACFYAHQIFYLANPSSQLYSTTTQEGL